MVKQLLRQAANWTLRAGGGHIIRTALRVGRRSALDTALSTALGVASGAVPGSKEYSHTQVFNLTHQPVTVYLRASHCRVIVRTGIEGKVRLDANVQRAFGVEFATEQDEVGVYIVVRRKPVVGAVSRAEFTLSVPQDAHLALHLTPGDVVFENVDGVIELPSALVFPPDHAHPQQSA